MRSLLFLWFQCEELAKEGALIGSSPADVIARCPITIAMLADPSVALSVGLPVFLEVFSGSIRVFEFSTIVADF